MNIDSRALVIFCKTPEPGRVKTRLARHLGDRFTADLYARFLMDTFAMARTTGARLVAAWDGDAGEAACYCDGAHHLFPQEGADLGERIAGALTATAALGYRHILVIGSDSPDLPAGYIDQGFRALADHHAVLGPAGDGGYYAIGIRSRPLPRDFFSGIHWSTSTALEETRCRFHERGMTCALLPHWQDIDDIEDLRSFAERNRTGTSAPLTSAFIKDNREALHGTI